jgi:hypothetical protein
MIWKYFIYNDTDLDLLYKPNIIKVLKNISFI